MCRTRFLRLAAVAISVLAGGIAMGQPDRAERRPSPVDGPRRDAMDGDRRPEGGDMRRDGNRPREARGDRRPRPDGASRGDDRGGRPDGNRGAGKRHGPKHNKAMKHKVRQWLRNHPEAAERWLENRDNPRGGRPGHQGRFEPGRGPAGRGQRIDQGQRPQPRDNERRPEGGQQRGPGGKPFMREDERGGREMGRAPAPRRDRDE
jgi:hypothetical protein